MARVGISLGSNLGDRLANLQKAVQHLAPLRSTDHLHCSGLYETEPIGCADDAPGFYNVVIEIETGLKPLELLAETQKIEALMGRPEVRAVNAPRPVDLDLLYYDDVPMETEILTLPHPRMLERAFVLAPLSEIREEFRVQLEALAGQKVTRIRDRWLD